MAYRKAIELWVGVFVAGGLVALLFLAFKVGNLASSDIGDSYTLRANFENIGQLKPRAPVTLAGVIIGRVSKISINSDYQAEVSMRISNKYRQLPVDSKMSILTSGLLGEQYIGVEPGVTDDYLKSNDLVEDTQPAMILEKLISRFMFSKASEGDNKK